MVSSVRPTHEARLDAIAPLLVARVAGIPLACVDVARAVDAVIDGLAARSLKVHVLVNAHSAKLRRESPEYASLLADTDRCVNLPDGASVTYAARLLGYGDIGRCPGPDLMEAICARAAAGGIGVFFLGGAEGVAKQLAQSLKERHQGLIVAGTATPPFGEWPEEESHRLVRAVKDSGARILFMGVSAPKQEIWAYEHLDQLNMPIVCVGAAFDFAIGRKSRAPRWMRRMGLEWVHRLVTEPGRMWKRYLVGNTQFVWDVIRFGRKLAPPPRERT